MAGKITFSLFTLHFSLKILIFAVFLYKIHQKQGRKDENSIDWIRQDGQDD